MQVPPEQRGLTTERENPVPFDALARSLPEKTKSKKVITYRWLIKVRIDLVFNLDIFCFTSGFSLISISKRLLPKDLLISKLSFYS